jgi:beta-1,4-mannosyl-glycoprotein beta-1,4-N-acetylglucosaminyltransferase
MLRFWSKNLKKNTICIELLYYAIFAGCFEHHEKKFTYLPVVEEHALIPRIVVKYPLNGSTANLPVSFRYMSTGECISELYIDGISLFRGFHSKDNNFTVDFAVPYLSYESHLASIDIVDSEGNLLEAGIVSLDFVVSADAVADAGDYYDEIEPTDAYDPNLSNEDKAKAVLKDGWLLIHQSIEFTRIEPIDSCKDIGWMERKKPRRIYDAFQFFNELDILEIRLHELQNVVHKFVLVEATRTHSNQPKPLYYELNKQRFSQFHNKILHIIVDDLPNSTDPWVLENFQRNTILRGLREAHPNDLVVIADVDEIPASYVLDAVRSCDGPTSPTWLYSRFFNFKFEWEFLGQWKHPQVVRFANLLPGAAGSVTPQQVRMGAMTPSHTKIESAGWHCSFFSDAEGVIQKVKAFTHQELNREVHHAVPRAT